MQRIQTQAKNLRIFVSIGLVLQIASVPLLMGIGLWLSVGAAIPSLPFLEFEPDPGLADTPALAVFGGFFWEIIRTLLWIHATMKLHTILGQWAEGTLFGDTEIFALKRIALTAMVLGVLPRPENLGLNHSLDFTTIGVGALLFLLARVWGEGRSLRQEVEATI